MIRLTRESNVKILKLWNFVSRVNQAYITIFRAEFRKVRMRPPLKENANFPVDYLENTKN